MFRPDMISLCFVTSSLDEAIYPSLHPVKWIMCCTITGLEISVQKSWILLMGPSRDGVKVMYVFCLIRQVFSVGFRSLPYQRGGKSWLFFFFLNHTHHPLHCFSFLLFASYLTGACIGLTLYKALAISDLVVVAIMKLPFSRDDS